MNRITRTYWTAKAVGWDNLSRRILQALRVKSGWLGRKLKPENFSNAAYSEQLRQPVDWPAVARRMPFTLPAQESLQKIADDNAWRFRVENVVDKARAGEFMYFSHWFAKPDDFNHDPVNDVHWPVGKHWVRGDTLGGTDIKLLWEPSRFSTAYFLGRHYLRTGDAAAAELFWKLVDAWTEQNPPQLTRNWSCGQEASFRMMAVLFGAVCTLNSPAATQERLDRAAMLAWRTAKQVSININYARSQGNNHAVSEAVGLITAGAVFNENFAQAEQWLRDGLSIMSAELARQVMDDGSYLQHSMSYHRLVMDDLLWTLGILKACGISAPAVLREKFEKMTLWLAEMTDAATGRVPNYGPNDGAKILPLSCCDYLDYRPTVQAAWYALYGKDRYAAGCWDEKKLWLFGEESLRAEKDEAELSSAFVARDGGYYVMRGPKTMLFTRCHTYDRRANQNDMLHVDLWHEGRNILRDAGSFSYNAPAPWGEYFSSTIAHNTVTVNDENQMIKGPRHLWFCWTRSRLLEWLASDDGQVGFFSGEHYGYSRLGVTHRRSILRLGDDYAILDEIHGLGDGMKTQLNWRLIPDDWQESFTDGGLRVVCGGIEIEVFAEAGFDVSFTDADVADGTAGWESLYYGRKSPCPRISATGRTQIGQTHFLTKISFGGAAGKFFDGACDASGSFPQSVGETIKKFCGSAGHIISKE